MANEDMIQTHVDNFLAKIAGETPIDDKPRNSTEFWLNEIAKWTAGQSTDDASTKKIYWHTVFFERYQAGYAFLQGYCVILTNTSTPITANDFRALLKSPGFVGVVINGRYGPSADPASTNADLCLIFNQDENNFSITVRSDTTHQQITNTGLSIVFSTVTDLGVNAIN